MSTTASRNQKWQPTPPPPPSPKILNLPRRYRHRRQSKKPTRKPSSSASSCLTSRYLKLHQHPQGHLLDLQEDKSYCYCSNDRKGKLESLFGEEREFSRSECSNDVPIVLLNSSSSTVSAAASDGGRRERVEDEAECGGVILEEKWKFQAEILRAECNFLRKEKELAFKKMEKNKKRIEKTLHSAVHTLISGKIKMLEGKNFEVVLEEEIEHMIHKLKHLQRGSGNKDVEIKKCKNFDKQANVLQRRLEKLGVLSEDQCVNEVMAEETLYIGMKHDIIDKESCVSGPISHGKCTDVEMLRMKTERLPKEMLDRIYDDCGSILSTPANSSVASSTSASKRIELPESTFSTRQLCQEPLPYDDSKCSGRCKAIIRKIVEQVRAETEQWNQMQVMLGKVREEMQELQVSCDFWEQRALNSENEMQHLQSAMQEWKEKALSFENKPNQLQTELSTAKGEIQKLRAADCIEPRRGGVVDRQTSCLFQLNQRLEENTKQSYKIDVKPCNEVITKKHNAEGVTSEVKPSTKAQPISLGKQLEKEKRMLLRRLKEKQHRNANGNQSEVIAEQISKSHMSNEGHVARSPFCDIGNLSALVSYDTRQNNSIDRAEEKHKYGTELRMEHFS